MTEPRRWLDDRQTSAELRQILESSGAPPPLPAEVHARLSELAVGLAAHGLLAQVGGTSLWQKLLLAVGGSSKPLVVAALIGATGAGTYVASRARVTPSVSASRASLRSAGPELPASRAFAPALPTDSSLLVPGRLEPHAEVLAVHPAPRAVPSADRELSNAAPPTAPSSGEESIADEAKLLQSARSFLGDSPALALQLTEQHRQLHPAAQLSAERELIAIEALLRLGRRQEAESRATPRLAQAPDSLYARRLRQLLTPTTQPAPKSENY